MAPVLAVVLLVEYAVLRLLHRADLRVPASRPLPEDAPSHARTPLVALLLMLAGFAALSPLGVDPFWVSGATAAALTGWALHHGLIDLRRATRAAHPGFAVFVLCLGVVVAALATGPLGTLVAEVLPTSTSFPGMLAIALLATVLANLLTNLSATLLLVPLLAPLGTPGVLAALIGLNVGSGLTYTGSLANLLWRRSLGRLGVDPGLADFHRVSLVATPLSLLAAVTTLWLTL
jgi:arsenical pump membrane protein